MYRCEDGEPVRLVQVAEQMGFNKRRRRYDRRGMREHE
jgi:hypothetical protein